MNENDNKKLVPVNLSLPHFPSSREKNKIIISNMASVLNSVKRKDKKYKKRRKPKCNINSTTCDELDDIHFISNGLTNNLKFISPKQNHSAADDKKDDINIDNSNNTASKTKAEQITLINNANIIPIKNNIIKLNDVSSTDTEINSSSIIKKTAKQNAFEVMMNARKKSIGVNSPGKNEINELSFENEEDVIRKSEKAKRKRKLEEWAEQKGSKKRKLQDETELLYIEKQLENRKKHFKQLLKNGKPQQKKQIEDNINSKNNNNNNTKYKRNKNTKANKKLVNNTDSIISVEEEDIEIINSTICKNTTKENISSVTKSIEIVTDKNEISKKTKASVVDTNDFLDKLSSPIKKRDSLFGYFDKISPSLTTDTKIVEEISPKYKATKLKTKNNENREDNEKQFQIDDVQQLSEQQKQITPTKNQRPRRECSKRIQSYKFDITPEKKIMQKSIRKAKNCLSKSPTQHKNKQLQQINNTDNNKFSKLAPIFNKTLKPIIDLSIITARQQFLMSGIPEKMKQELIRQKTFEEQYEINFELFPLISHITQLQSNDDWLKTSTIKNIKLNKLLLKLYVDKDDNKHIEIVPYKNIKLLNNSQLLTKYYQNIKIYNNNAIAKLKNVKLLLKNLKINFGTFPINRCYKQLNKKYLNNNNSYNDGDDDDGDADDGDNSCQIINDNCFNNNNNGQETFTEKYKPLISNEFFINSKSINQLKDFLINWKLKQKRNSSDDNDDDDYFENTNSSSNFNSQQHMNNAIVLLGPSGCGKTNAVYAIANELNFNVIEVNASNKRTGKKIVKQLQEATKSHLIGSNENEKYSTTTVTTNSSNNNSDSADEHLNDNKKLSLILIEDADCVFEQDIGFIDAINQLILTSKRPVILIANNANCAHLLKIQQNLIKFKCGNVHNTIKWLLMLAINEHYFINIYSLEKLYLYNNCDLRKTILDVQFYIQSNGDYNYINEDDRVPDNGESLENTASHYNHRKLFEYFTYSQNYLHKISQIPICRPIDLKLIDFCKYSTEIYSNYHSQQQMIKEKSPKSIAKNVNEDEHLFFDNILNFYDNITTAIRIHDRTIQDGITNNLENDIIYELIDNTFLQQNLQWNNDNYTFVNDDKKNKSGALLTNIISDNFYDKQSINLDYEPCLRSICRSEKNRSICDRTGTKRFYHYFRNSNGLSFSTNIFDEQCNFFS